MRKHSTIVAGLAGALLGGAAVYAYIEGAGTQTLMGAGISAEHTVSVEADGHTYRIPTDVAWTDADGFHEWGRPACLPPTGGTIKDVRFSATEVQADGVTFRQVYFVDCR